MNTIEYTNRGVCSVCGKPADGAINVASHWQSPMKMESRCEEHGAFVGSFIPRARLAELEAARVEVARLRTVVDAVAAWADQCDEALRFLQEGLPAVRRALDTYRAQEVR